MFQNNKSQMKMLETISVLMVFLLILVFVLIMYIGLSKSTGRISDDEKLKLRAIEISQTISYMPEFQCGTKNIVKDICFDLVSIEAFQRYTNGSQQGFNNLNTVYYDFFKFSSIVAYEIYPRNKVWRIYERLPNLPRYSERQTHVPMSLYDAREDKYYFGMLNVTVFG